MYLNVCSVLCAIVLFYVNLSIYCVAQLFVGLSFMKNIRFI